MRLNNFIKRLNEQDKAIVNNLLAIDNLKNKYIYIYDFVCEKLDKEFKEKNYCDFQDNMCICQRNSKNNAHNSMGCCYTFENSKLTGFPINTKLCPFLNNGSCSQSCIACKLHTCSYLKKQNIKFSPNDFILIKLFFNRKQKLYIQNAFFKSREEIIDKLVSLNTKL